MAANYPDSSYFFASPFPEPAGRGLRRLRKEYIRQVLHELHEVAHHVYVLLEALPAERFSIVRYDDHVRSRMGLSPVGDGDPFTLHQFIHYYELLHEQDCFRVFFFKEVCYYEQGFTPHVLEMVYRQYLKYACEQGLRSNKPVGLTAVQVEEYGLTRSDAECVEELLGRFNKAAVQAFRDEYAILSTLDCIKNQVP